MKNYYVHWPKDFWQRIISREEIFLKVFNSEYIFKCSVKLLNFDVKFESERSKKEIKKEISEELNKLGDVIEKQTSMFQSSVGVDCCLKTGVLEIQANSYENLNVMF